MFETEFRRNRQLSFSPTAFYSPRRFSTMTKILSLIRIPFKKRPDDSDIVYLLFPHFANHYKSTTNNITKAKVTATIPALSCQTRRTNATMNNDPWTGRTVDTYLYHYFGRKLERCVFRVSLANLSPDRILQFLWVDVLAYSWANRSECPSRSTESR